MISDHNRKTLDAGQFHINHFKDAPSLPLHVPVTANDLWSGTHSFERKKSELFVLELVTAGNVLFIQNGKKYLVQAGDIFVLHLDSAHHYSVGPAGYMHKRIVQINGALLEPLLRSTGLLYCDHIRPKNRTLLESYFRQANQESIQKKPGYLIRLSALAYELLLLLGQEITPKLPTVLGEATSFIQQNMKCKLSSMEIAAQVGLSETHLNRLFRVHLKSSPIRYLINQRLLLAQYLLKQTNFSIKEIAEMTGFGDPFYFSAQFKKYLRSSPKIWRDKAK